MVTELENPITTFDPVVQGGEERIAMLKPNHVKALATAVLLPESETKGKRGNAA